MTASRRAYQRAIDWQAANPEGDKLRNLIKAFLSRRTNPQSQRDIERWFFATKPDFIDYTLADMIRNDMIFCGSSSTSRRNRVLHFWVTGGAA
jgi:hypothetical protein